ncbi:MAG: Hsp33 family molecular chaperone HslO [Oligoflexia bacterium]|nr:Hsp33 family molecular chaperone HslO [Oligoflexia bacterium]
MAAAAQVENGDSDQSQDQCHCTLERVKTAIVLMGPEEIKILISEGVAAQAQCEFCGRKYEVEINELKKLLIRSEKS